LKRILIITGEASGDLHGAHLALALKQLDPDVSLLGVGGARMKSAGVQLIPDTEQLDVIGLIGPRALRAVFNRVRTLDRVLRREAVDLVVLIDHPGLNLHFARVAKQAGHRVVYYITPQIWAWRSGRMRLMQRYVDHAMVILPFEESFYRHAGVECSFVGHPLLDDMAPSYDRDGIRARYGIPRDHAVLGLLPGSRQAEVEALLPVMLEGARLLDRDRPLRLILAVAETVDQDRIKATCEAAALDVRLISGDPNGVIAASDLLFAASGTVTLQAAIIGTPMVIVYKMPWISYLLAKLLVHVDSVGLANIIAGRPFIPELIQLRATPRRLAQEAGRILGDAQRREAMVKEMARVRACLGAPGASQRAAVVVLKVLRQQGRART
jgi:lipid-A-disaccharide synthase